MYSRALGGVTPSAHTMHGQSMHLLVQTAVSHLCQALHTQKSASICTRSRLACLQAVKNALQEGIVLELVHAGVAHGDGALPLARAGSHGQEGVQVKAPQGVNALEAASALDTGACQGAPQGHYVCGHLDVVICRRNLQAAQPPELTPSWLGCSSTELGRHKHLCWLGSHMGLQSGKCSSGQEVESRVPDPMTD